MFLFQPHNILLGRDMTPVLMDFGSCTPARVSVRNMREAQYLQDTAAERSSMCYRPPELFQVSSSCDIDERTDIWSLGCLLYAMMCGHSPYDPVYERGDSVALAVQAGKIEFEEHGYSEDLVQLVAEGSEEESQVHNETADHRGQPNAALSAEVGDDGADAKAGAPGGGGDHGGDQGGGGGEVGGHLQAEHTPSKEQASCEGLGGPVGCPFCFS